MTMTLHQTEGFSHANHNKRIIINTYIYDVML